MVNVPKHKSGFTLIEVVLGFAIMSILVAVLYGLSINSIKSNKASELKQKASLAGQKVIEDFKSTDVSKKKTDVAGSGLYLSNGIKLTGTDGNWSINNYDLGDGYKADITVQRNASSITSGQMPVTDTTVAETYTVNLKKISLNTISMSDDNLKTTPENQVHWDSVNIDIDKKSDPTIIRVDVTESSSGKSIKVSIPGSSVSFPKESDTFKTKKQILLAINCENYNISGSDKDTDGGFEVDVYNQSKEPLNVSLQKTNTIQGTVSALSGNVKVFNNRSSSEAVNNGDLYDITVQVKNDSVKDSILYKSQSSQNLNIQK